MTFVYLQLLACIYLGWLLLLILPIFLLVYILGNQNFKLRLQTYFLNNKLHVSGILITYLLSNMALLLPYVNMSRLIGKRSMEEVSTMMPHFFSWLSPPPNSLWSSILLMEPFTQYLRLPWWENLFIGFTVISLTVLILYVCLKKRAILGEERFNLVRACLFVTSLIFLVSLKELDLWKFVHLLVPGAGAIRVVIRVSLILYFFLIISITLNLDSFLKATLSRKWRLIISSSICILAMCEQILIHPISYEKAPILKLESELQSLMIEKCDLAYVSFGQNDNSLSMAANQLSAMWAGLKAGVPVINGYSSGPPPNYPNFDSIPKLSDLQRWVKDDFTGQLCLISSVKSEHQNSAVHYQSSTIEFPLVQPNPDRP